jgi:Rad3-related DNA helicase
MSEKKITVSVREMVEFILRRGDIDNRYQSAISPQEGTRLHTRLQKKRAKEALLNDFDYEKEVFLAHTFEIDGFSFTVEGRADGVIRSGETVAIEEIKSTLAPPEAIEKDETHWHWAQAKCYAFMLAAREKFEKISVRLTYIHVDSFDTASLETEYAFAEIRIFFMDLTAQYFQWAAMDYERKRRRNTAIKQTDFPHDSYRAGQRDFAVAVYQTIRQQKKLFAQAPTGTGKTISVLFPAVKAVGEGLADKIFYLTAKTITRQTAEDAAALLNEKGAETAFITLTAKEKICFCDKTNCNPVDCAYARGHYDRVNHAVWDIITSESCIKRQIVEDYANRHMVCPHEFQLDITLWTDMIIGDYNYVFDPKAQLKRFFADKPREKYLFLIDEAHNLVDRSREMYSETLYKSDFIKLKKELKTIDPVLSKISGKINKYLLEMKKTYFADEKIVISKDEPNDLYYLLRDFSEKMDLFLGRRIAEPSDYLLEKYFQILDFITISEFFSDRYVVFMENSREDFSVKLLCLDASEILAEIQKKAVASVFFSATLTPLTYFKDVLGGNDTDFRVRITSPFQKEKLCLIVENRISTKYKSREASYDRIAESLQTMIAAKKGNYFVFFPSYAYLEKVYDRFLDLSPETETIVQTQGMAEEDRESFLRNFTENNEKTLLAFAVMGGIFSEGIDLKGERLSGAAIVGVGLPLITPERDTIAEYYNQAREHSLGFEYAYVYPGMNKVLQSAGRVIRTESDIGVVLLIDDRFISARYLELFPPEWADYKKASGIGDIGSFLADFWLTAGIEGGTKNVEENEADGRV